MTSWPPIDEPPDREPLVIQEDMLAPDRPEARADFEKGMSPLPGWSILVIVAAVSVFGWELAVGALANQQAIIDAGALHRDHVLRGEYWRLLSAAFLHGSPAHLVGNCVALYIVGMACEHAFGWRRTAVIFLASAIGGSLVSISMQTEPSVGASGAVFGLMGAVIVFFYKHQNTIMLRDKRIGFVLLIWAMYQIGLGVLDPMIDNFAHIGGLAAGAMASLLLRPVLVCGADEGAERDAGGR